MRRHKGVRYAHPEENSSRSNGGWWILVAIGTFVMGLLAGVGATYFVMKDRSDTGEAKPGSSGYDPEFKLTSLSKTVEGTKGTLDFKMFFKLDGKEISPWHDIPLFANKEKTLVHFMCEIPKGSAAKYEISRTIKGNPIVQDRKKNGSGKEVVRSYMWPKDNPQMYWNYGALPQTWEDPSHQETDIDHPTGKHPVGDNDPIDAMCFGKTMETGQVTPVKVLGVLALIDNGETDWKLICADPKDPSFKDIHTLDDLLKIRKYKEAVQKMSDWLRDYKKVSKKQVNHIHFKNPERSDAKDEKYAMEKILQTHGFWAKHFDHGRKNRELKN